jgi:NAD(P)-dependent dehydrogenase (short-subunit alcohol dehydrogenase family)
VICRRRTTIDLGLRGKTVLVIGGSAGIGRAVAEVLAGEGAGLFLVARRESRLKEVAATVEAVSPDGRVAWRAADVAEPGQAEDAVAAAIEWAGRLDAVAVVAGPMGPRGQLHEQDDAAWEHYFQAGLMAAVRTLRTAVPHFVEQGGGSVVTTASYSIRAQKPDMAHYTAMKTALASVTKNIARTYGHQGIRANCVVPGLIDTIGDEKRTTLAARYGVGLDEALFAHGTRGHGLSIALGRAGQSREVAELIAFLLSDRAAYLTGATINIDGGTDF